MFLPLRLSLPFSPFPHLYIASLSYPLPFLSSLSFGFNRRRSLNPARGSGSAVSFPVGFGGAQLTNAFWFNLCGKQCLSWKLGV